MSGRTPIIFLLPLLLFVGLGGQAEELSFSAAVDRQQLSLGDQLTLTVSVAGKGMGSISQPEAPPLDGFEVVGTNSSTSSQIQFINGRMSSSKTIDFIYYLQPTRVGELKIGSFKLKVKGKTYRTDPIAVQVTKPVGGGVPQPTPQLPAGRVSGRRGDLFLLATYSPQRVYIGEQVTATYLLCTRRDLTNVQLGQSPSNTGFWAEELYQAKTLNFHPQVINGKRYNVAKIREVALFPTTTGKLKINPMELVCDVQLRSNDFFDFWGRSKRMRIRSNPGEIRVSPLPKLGEPPGFAGAVGHFTVQAAIDKKEVAAGNPINLTVTIQGTGNLKLMSPPLLPSLDGFKRYEPEVEEKISKANLQLGGRKTFKYVLIPEKPGRFQIDPIVLPYFDPQAKCYRQASSQPLVLQVTPGEKEEKVAALPLSREVKLLGRDIRYIKPDLVELSDGGRELYRSPLYILLHIFPLLAIFASFAYRKHHLRISEDIGYARMRRAKGLTQRRLREAKGLLKEGLVGEFYGTIAKALTDYIGDRLNIEATGLTTDQLLDLLKERGYPSEVREKYLACYDNCDLARFSPSDISTEEMEETLKLAQEAILALEKTTKGGRRDG